mmetsp:Transcript_72275/g.127358  ORF Transcript_72275/g.127358 Transcript_72275/m.127358 type:complete len:282 (+) Transcript_72275:41-886(+)
MLPQASVLKCSWPAGRVMSPLMISVMPTLIRRVSSSRDQVPGDSSTLENAPTPTGITTPPSCSSTAMEIIRRRPLRAHVGGIHVPLSLPMLSASSHCVPMSSDPSCTLLNSPPAPPEKALCRRRRFSCKATAPMAAHSSASRMGCRLGCSRSVGRPFSAWNSAIVGASRLSSPRGSSREARCCRAPTVSSVASSDLGKAAGAGAGAGAGATAAIAMYWGLPNAASSSSASAGVSGGPHSQFCSMTNGASRRQVQAKILSPKDQNGPIRTTDPTSKAAWRSP